MLPFTFYRSLTCLLGFRMTDGPFMKWSVTLTLHMDGSVDATAFKMIRAKIKSFSLTREQISFHGLKDACNQIFHIYKNRIYIYLKFAYLNILILCINILYIYIMYKYKIVWGGFLGMR